MSTTQGNSVPDTQLGLSSEEVALLRQHQAAVAGGGSSSSRAASRASSQGQLMVDAGSLAVLGRHFDRVMAHIQQQVEYLSEQAQVVTMQVYDHAGNLIDNADAEIARYHDIMRQLDELEVDFDRIRHIRDIVKDFRRRAEQLERDLDSAAPTSARREREEKHHSSSSKHGHSSHRHGHASSSGKHRH